MLKQNRMQYIKWYKKMTGKVRKAGRWFLIIILLPYMITVFINGPKAITSSKADEILVKLKDGETMPAEEYCIGILAKDISADYEEETLKAQAVLVRTEVYRQIQNLENEGTLEEYWTAKQMKAAWGMRYAQNYKKLKNALEQTTGQVLFYGENLAMTPFFKLSNGYTRDTKEVLGSEEYPYLKIVKCPEDVKADNEIWTGVLTDVTDVEIQETDSVGYVLKVRVGEETISGEEFRSRYNLPSSCFTLQRYHDKLWVTTRGIGHGIGMSQYTANEMAKEKKGYKKILKYFFEGTRIIEVTDIVKNVEEQE